MAAESAGDRIKFDPAGAARSPRANDERTRSADRGRTVFRFERERVAFFAPDVDVNHEVPADEEEPA